MDQIAWTKVERGILKSNTGKYRARITKTMPDGSTKQFCRDARTLDDARANLKELKGDFKGVKRGDDTERIQNKIKGRRMKFRELARIFQDAKLTAPIYDDENSPTSSYIHEIFLQLSEIPGEENRTFLNGNLYNSKVHCLEFNSFVREGNGPIGFAVNKLLKV